MKRLQGFTAVFVVWLAWVFIVIGFQALSAARYTLQAPDNVLIWTGGETRPHAHDDQIYLNEPFLNQQVAYDSEYYLSIAIAGYDDPAIHTVYVDPNRPPYNIFASDLFPLPVYIPAVIGGWPDGIPTAYRAISLNYAFLPFYPLAIRVASYPLSLLGLNPIATATLAGVLVSCLGALGAMLALYDLTRDRLSDRGALRTAFYLVVFPTGFFLAMVYTEGLFVGLAFGSLALLRRKKWVWAALLAAMATWTRAAGGALVIPLALAWLREADMPALRRWPPDWRLWAKGLLVLSPVAAYGLWRLALGEQFDAIQAAYFNRQVLAIGPSLDAWAAAYRSLWGARSVALSRTVALEAGILTVLLMAAAFWRRWLAARLPRPLWIGARIAALVAGVLLAGTWFRYSSNDQRTVYYLLEFLVVILVLVACAYTLREYPGLALFSLAVLVISFFSSVTQGMTRYLLGAPVIFVMLAHLGADDRFDRVWTLASILLLGMSASLFAFNFWVG